MPHQFQRRRARRPKKRAPSSPNTAGCVARRRMGVHLAASTRRAGPLTLLTLSITLLPHHQLDDMPADVPGPLQDEVWHAAEFLAGLLLPKRALCHQRERCVTESSPSPSTTSFLSNNPVHKDVRGRGEHKHRVSSSEDVSSFAEFASTFENDGGADPPTPPPTSSYWLETFHVAFVHEVPDPSSSTSGNIASHIHAHGARTYEEYMNDARSVSSVAPAMKTLYESIKSHSLAHLTIHNLPMELQLPPYLDTLLHNTDDEELQNTDGIGTWGRNFSVGAWRPPALEPWKSLLLLSGPDGSGREWVEVYAAIRGTNVREEDKLLAEQLVKFLETAVDVTLFLMDMAGLLDWHLETLYVKDLAKEFRDAFPDPSIPSLPQLLATISGASSNHFYAIVVKSNDRVPMFHDVVPWMLQRDLLVTPHLRYMRCNAGAVEPPIFDEGIDFDEEIEKDAEAAEAEAEAEEASPGEEEEDDNGTSILTDPGRATPLQSQWLQVMLEGKDELFGRRFDQINQYFDRKCTNDVNLQWGNGQEQFRVIWTVDGGGHGYLFCASAIKEAIRKRSRKENAASLNAEVASAVVGISNRNEASTPPVAADSSVPADYYGDVEFGEFDYDAVNADEHAELWLIRAPTAAMKSSLFQGVKISPRSCLVGDIHRKSTAYDMYTLEPLLPAIKHESENYDRRKGVQEVVQLPRHM
ncbi:hypothetical protein BGW80DRAFT_1255787 [Lactifluus volemus]|nr:hypothetical protein BGW80DRAFT_1255787 [Lactifluus volemus]